MKVTTQRGAAFNSLEMLSNDDCEIGMAYSYSKQIRNAVAVSVVTWENLGTSDEKITQRLREVYKLTATNWYTYLGKGWADANIRRNALILIRQWVVRNFTSWEELGFTEAELLERTEEKVAK